MRHVAVTVVTVLILISPALPGAFQAPSSPPLETAAKEAEAAGRLKDAFDLYVRAVQALPDPAPFDEDVRLRERVVALAARIDPPPVAPEDAVRLQVRGQVLLKDAKDEKGFEEAAGELRKAVRAAPWVVDFAYNLALVQEKLEYYRAAAANLKLYVSMNPSEGNDIRAKIYELELRREKNKAAAAREDCALNDLNACSLLSEDFIDRVFEEMKKDKPTIAEKWGPRTKELIESWYRFGRKSCDGGEMDGCGQLGSHMMLWADLNHAFADQIAHADITEAIRLLSKGCEGGKTSAPAWCHILAEIYEKGELVRKDNRLARTYYQRACTGGLTTACKR